MRQSERTADWGFQFLNTRHAAPARSRPPQSSAAQLAAAFGNAHAIPGRGAPAGHRAPQHERSPIAEDYREFFLQIPVSGQGLRL